MKKEKFSYQSEKGKEHYFHLKAIFSAMTQRVKNNLTYLWKDIKICEEWNDKEHGFSNFYNWAIKNGYDYKPSFINGKYQNSITLDRIDCFGDYSPANCRWCSWNEQNSNKVKHKMFYEERVFLHDHYKRGLPCSYKDYERETGKKIDWR